MVQVFIKITGDEKELIEFNSLFYKGEISYEYVTGSSTKKHAFTFDKIMLIQKNLKNQRLERCRYKLWGTPMDISEICIDAEICGTTYRSSAFSCGRYFINNNKLEAEFCTDYYFEYIKFEKFFKFASTIFTNLEFFICKNDNDYCKFSYFLIKNGEIMSHEDGTFDDEIDIYLKYYGYTLAMAYNNGYVNYDFIGEIETRLKEKTIDELIDEDSEIESIFRDLGRRGITFDEILSQKRLPDIIRLEK